MGGHGKLPMEALRAMYERLGFVGARTYVQSGNVVCRGSAAAVKASAKKVADAVEKEHGFRPVVIMRTADQLRAVVKANPFTGKRAIEPNKLLVMFLSGLAATGAKQALEGVKKGREELVLAGGELFMSFPDGVGASKLSLAAVERALGAAGTSRNWNTVTKVLAMAEGMEAGG